MRRGATRAIRDKLRLRVPFRSNAIHLQIGRRASGYELSSEFHAFTISITSLVPP
jgi:hypothetical protein